MRQGARRADEFVALDDLWDARRRRTPEEAPRAIDGRENDQLPVGEVRARGVNQGGESRDEEVWWHQAFDMRVVLLLAAGSP